jgi:hypothetical protein
MSKDMSQEHFWAARDDGLAQQELDLQPESRPERFQ